MDRPDPRPEATRNALADAMTQLVTTTEDVSQISVALVCRTAQVSRPTFYQHYKSVDELFADVLRRRLEGAVYTLVQVSTEQFDEMPAALAWVLRDIWNDRRLYWAVLAPASPFVQTKIVVFDWVEERIRAHARTISSQPDVLGTRLRFAIGGIASVIGQMLLKDHEDEDEFNDLGEAIWTIVIEVLKLDGRTPHRADPSRVDAAADTHLTGSSSATSP